MVEIEISKGSYTSIWDDLVSRNYIPTTFEEIALNLHNLNWNGISEPIKAFNRVAFTPEAFYVESQRTRDVHKEEREGQNKELVIRSLQTTAKKVAEPFKRNYFVDNIESNEIIRVLAGNGLSNLSQFINKNQLKLYLSVIAKLPSQYAFNFPKLYFDKEDNRFVVYAGGYLAVYDDFDEFGIGIKGSAYG